MSDYYSNKHNKSLPAMLKCAADGKLEKNSMFSSNMLKKRSFNPNAQITCRKHTASAATELLCSSCRKQKPIDFFSKNERKSSGAQRCRACVEWIECDEPDSIPLPAPNSIRDHKEKEVYKGDSRNHVPFHVDEDGDYVTEAYARAVDDSWMGRSSETTGAETGEGLTLENLQIINDARNSRSTSSHGGGSYHPSSAPTDSASTAGTEDTTRPRVAHQFNAYGPNGQLQKRQTSTASSVTSGTSRSTTAGKNWARPATRKYAPALPRHMEFENPDTVGYDAYDDDDSSDGC
ncbi:hypothetical protein SLS64_000567 [Diaporthe eres]|uniref:Stc1 domain-containing protein n=1 Tax=Diaporthe eres TaxID=83184 RepID=A0ABR1PME0_DIAER